MRALSLWQPWATLVAIGVKQVETRSWQTKYSGPLAIHATQHMPAEARELVDAEPFRSALAQHYGEGFMHEQLPRGGIIAVVDLQRCTLITEDAAERLALVRPWEFAFGDYTPGRFAWVMENVRCPVDKIACNGARGVWEVDEDLLERVNGLMR